MTAHQYRIAKYRIEGWTAKEISEFLGIKPKTPTDIDSNNRDKRVA